MPKVLAQEMTINGDSSTGGDVAIQIRIEFTPEEIEKNNVYVVWAFILQDIDPRKVVVLRRSLTLFNVVALDGYGFPNVMDLSSGFSPENSIVHKIPLVCSFDQNFFQSNITLSSIIGISPKDGEIYAPFPVSGVLT